jgi:hypothetical protein
MAGTVRPSGFPTARNRIARIAGFVVFIATVVSVAIMWLAESREGNVDSQNRHTRGLKVESAVQQAWASAWGYPYYGQALLRGIDTASTSTKIRDALSAVDSLDQEATKQYRVQKVLLEALELAVSGSLNLAEQTLRNSAVSSDARVQVMLSHVQVDGVAKKGDADRERLEIQSAVLARLEELLRQHGAKTAVLPPGLLAAVYVARGRAQYYMQPNDGFIESFVIAKGVTEDPRIMLALGIAYKDSQDKAKDDLRRSILARAREYLNAAATQMAASYYPQFALAMVYYALDDKKSCVVAFERAMANIGSSTLIPPEDRRNLADLAAWLGSPPDARLPPK